MTVEDLILALQEMNPEAEVRIASIGHRTHLEYRAEEPEEVDLEDGKTVVYLAEGSQIGYLPSAARRVLGV